MDDIPRVTAQYNLIAGSFIHEPLETGISVLQGREAKLELTDHCEFTPLLPNVPVVEVYEWT